MPPDFPGVCSLRYDHEPRDWHEDRVLDVAWSAKACDEDEAQALAECQVPVVEVGPQPGRTQTMKIRPLQDRLIVERLEPEATTKGGIIIPAAAQEAPLQGKVVAVGNGKLLEGGQVRPLDIKEGDTVLFAKYAGTEVHVEGKEQLMLREEDVLGVVEK